MKNLIPNNHFSSVLKIDKEIFKNKSVIILDIDNTLFFAESTKTKQEIVSWVKGLNKSVQCICLSNSYTISKRKNYIESLLECPVYISQHKKPSKKLFKELQNFLKIPANQMVMVGDMRMTDILFGNRHGMHTILVDPLGPEKLKRIKIARAIENVLVQILPSKNI